MMVETHAVGIVDVLVLHVQYYVPRYLGTFHVPLFAVTLAVVSEGAFPEARLRLPFERRHCTP